MDKTHGLCLHEAYLLIGQTKKSGSSQGQFKTLLKVFKEKDRLMLLAFFILFSDLLI